MAARKRKLTLNDDWKERIRAGVLMDRLMKHVDGSLDMTTTQLKAAEILLKKIVPDLARSDVNQTINGELDIRGLTITLKGKDES